MRYLANYLYAILMCKVCGSVVKVIQAGNGVVVCCGHAMEQLNKSAWGA